MSNREYAKNLIDQIPDNKISNIIVYLQEAASPYEQADDDFCEKMYQDYLSSDIEDKETIDLSEAAKALGVTI